jgi:hypothetical protein
VSRHHRTHENAPTVTKETARVTSLRRLFTGVVSSINPFAADGGDSDAQSARTASAGPSNARTQGGSIAALLSRLRTKRCAAAAAGGLVLGVAGASSALAATPAPHWALDSLALPTAFSTAANGPCLNTSSLNFCANTYEATATEVGSAATDGSAVTLADQLPVGLTATTVELLWSGYPGVAGNQHNLAALCATAGQDVTCTLPASFFTEQGRTVGPEETLRLLVRVEVDEPATPGTLENQATITGGGAPAASISAQNPLEGPPPSFGLTAFDSPALGADGQDATTAAAHPYALHTRIDFTGVYREAPNSQTVPTSIQDPRDVLVDLPPGLAGSALSTPERCTLAQLNSNIGNGVADCPAASVIGHIRNEPAASAAVDSPLYNMVPEHGVAAELGYSDILNGSHVLYASLVPTPAGYVLRTTSPEIPQVPMQDIEVSVYGDPAARDAGRQAEAGDLPTLTSPADCSGEPLLTQIHLDSWQNPGPSNPDGSPNLADPAWVSSSSAAEPVSGCEGLQFHPQIEARPETNQGDKPTGLEVTLKVPQSEDATTTATPPLRKAVVTLPAGMSVNPSSANGLTGCSLADLGMSASGQPNAAPPNCPDSSKLGEVELETPALPGVLHGQIYVAKQKENPFGTLLAIYIVVNDPTTGVVVKLPGEVRADPQTGQLQTVVDNSPQFPFSELRTKFFGGQKAALRTPAVCGTYKVTSQLTPWSAPESGPPATPSASFQISQGCAPSAAQQPNSPSFSAGTLNPLAGAYSPFVLKLSREDGSQELSGLNVTLPPGLVGKLAGLSECSDAALAAAAAKSGVAEQHSPSCPPSSEVGTVTVGAGAGLTPYYATGHAYLAGPYKGAPLSLAIITPAVAGPYDLGDVVVRTALQVDPFTAQITAVSDPIPHILDGIPLDVRSIALNMNRSQFTLNPTSCEKMAISGSATSVLGQAAPLTNPFQVGGCKKLGFKPKLALSLKGGTKRHDFPALRAVLTYPKKGSYANIAKAQVSLPHAEFLEQGHIDTVCTRPQLAARQCPAGAIYGHAKAWTPLLDKPLAGPVYLGVGFGHELPDLVAELNGQIRVLLHGKVDTDKADGLRNTFTVVPDAPVSKFVLELKGGKKGLLVNSEPICGKTSRASANFTAQNGRVLNLHPVIANSCKKKGKKGTGKHHKGSGRQLGRLELGALLGAW